MNSREKSIFENRIKQLETENDDLKYQLGIKKDQDLLDNDLRIMAKIGDCIQFYADKWFAEGDKKPFRVNQVRNILTVLYLNYKPNKTITLNTINQGLIRLGRRAKDSDVSSDLISLYVHDAREFFKVTSNDEFIITDKIVRGYKLSEKAYWHIRGWNQAE